MTGSTLLIFVLRIGARHAGRVFRPLNRGAGFQQGRTRLGDLPFDDNMIGCFSFHQSGASSPTTCDGRDARA